MYIEKSNTFKFDTMNLVRRQPSNFLPSFLDEMFANDRVYTSDFQSRQLPAVNIQETEQAFVLELAVPGLKKEDLTVEVEKELLSITSEATKSADTTTSYTRKEYSFEDFRRTFSIPESVETKKIDAQYHEGILTVSLPKKKEVIVEETKKSIRIR